MEMARVEEDAGLLSELSITEMDMTTVGIVSTTPVSTSSPAITTTRNSNFLYIVEPLANITINAGKEVRIKCHVRGNPPPRFRWFKNEAPFEGEKRGRVTIRKDEEGSKIRIRNLDVPDTGFYRCEASNGYKKVETTGVLRVVMVPGKTSLPLDLEDLDHDYEEPVHVTENPDASLDGTLELRSPDITTPGTCHIYKGTACTKFLRNVTIYIPHGQSQTNFEERLMAAFAAIPKHTELSTQCTEYAIPSLCYHLFPICDEGTTKKRPRELCKDECDLLQSEVCRKEFAAASEHHQLRQFMPNCATLPPEDSVEHRKCIRLGLRASKQGRVTKEECYSETGSGYSGMVKNTISGGECKKWDGVHYPDYAHHNYCRNPGGLQNRPWCFSAHSDLPETCSVSKCARPVETSYTNFLYIAGGCGALLFLIVAIALLVCFCRRMKKKDRKEAFKANIKANPLELNALIPKYHIHGQVPEIQMADLRFLDLVGIGSFAKVYTGDMTTDGYTKVVILRMLQEAGNGKAKQEFQRELSQWADYRHPNVVSLLGAHTQRDPLVMVFEHTTFGDLHEYLEALSDRSTKSLKNMDSTNTLEFLHIATQIAAGFEYLAANCYVHRDVAARNCWVFDNGLVKVADHGVGPVRYPEDYSRVQTLFLPIRWMAPESINYNQFTLHSSVWSFGVLMWEIWAEGRQPYYGCSLQEILQMIRTRQLLPQPEDCPGNVYALMVECWHENSIRRPSFKELHQRLWNWEHGRYGTISNADLNNSSRSRSTVSQHSSNGPHSNNTGSTHISNGFAIANPNNHNFAAVANSPNINKFGNGDGIRRPVLNGGNGLVPPSPMMRHSAMNTPQLKGPRFVSSLSQQPSGPNNTLNFDSFRTTNL